jgi:glycerate dehydrogenase
MDIVILDGYALNPGDLGWEAIEAFGNLAVYDRTAPEQVRERAEKADLVLTNKTPLPAEVLRELPKLKYIGVLATGYNIIDTACARERGITVTNIPGYSTDSVAQLVFALLLELLNGISAHNAAVHNGEWVRSADFSFTVTPLSELSGKVMGIIGYGSIGRQVSRIARAFGMRVVTVDRGRRHGDGAEYLPLEEVLAQADVLSLHCPQTPETVGLINAAALARMKPSAVLINTARGGLIVEQDLADALNAGRLAGAGLDVLSAEPPVPANPLLAARNCVITPHIGWATREARSRLMGIAAENIRSFLAGKPCNVVS